LALAAVIGADTVAQFLIFCEEEKKRIDAWHALRPRPKKPQGGEFIVHVSARRHEAGRCACHVIGADSSSVSFFSLPDDPL
jgi:hypothetical protein